jgi:hypothetical protein
LKVDPNLRLHPRFLRFKTDAGLGVSEALGVLLGIWSYCYTFAPDGDVAVLDPDDLAYALEWPGDHAAIWHAFLGHFTEDSVIHDWSDWGGARFAALKKDAERQFDRYYDKQGKVSTENDGEPRRTSENHTDKIREEKKNKSVGENDGFEAYWTAYPRKLGKPAAQRFWRRLSTEDRIAATAAARNMAVAVAAGNPDLQHCPYGSSFIGRDETFRDWADGIPAGYGGQTAGLTSELAEWEAAVGVTP